MGLRDKAAQFRWGTHNIDLDHLEDQYSDKVLSKGELLAIKSQIKTKIESMFNTKEVIIQQLTPVLGIHTGPEMYAIIARQIR